MNHIKSNVKHNRFHTKFLNLWIHIEFIEVRSLSSFYFVVVVVASISLFASFLLASKSFHFDFLPISKSSSHNLTFNRDFLCERRNARSKKRETNEKRKCPQLIQQFQQQHQLCIHVYKKKRKRKYGYHRLFKRHKLLTHLLFIFIDLKTATPTIKKLLLCCSISFQFK